MINKELYTKLLNHNAAKKCYLYKSKINFKNLKCI